MNKKNKSEVNSWMKVKLEEIFLEEIVFQIPEFFENMHCCSLMTQIAS